MSLQPGDRIGDYEILSVLGAGGMGKVYKVRNVISERVEAMKVLLPNLQSDPELADRFMREIKVQGSLDHPNIAGLHTAQRLDNQLVMLMEFVEGVTIEEQMQAGAISLEKGVEYISQVLSALGYAHARGVVHRDIKPANMMLTPSGVVKLMDFGIAKISADPKLTQTGRTLGSLYYMSPEQINGLTLDARSDLYSLGVSLYEIVTGTRPFKGDSDYSIMAAHLNSSPVPPLQIDPKLPAMLSEIVMMSIAREAPQRFQSADAFRNALQSLRFGSEGTVPIQPVQAREQAPPVVAAAVAAPPSSRRGLFMAVGSVVTVAVLALAAIQGSKQFKSSDAASTVVVSAPVAEPLPVAEPPKEQPKEIARAAVPEAATPTEPKTKEMKPVEGAGAAELRTRDFAKPIKPKELLTAQNTPLVNAQAPVTSVFNQTATKNTLPPPAPAVDEAKAAALRENRELLAMLDTRASSVKGSIQTLQQQQTRSGLNLRGDIVVAQQRMELFLNEAESSLKAGDPSRVKKNLDSAERELEKLEKFLGR